MALAFKLAHSIFLSVKFNFSISHRYAEVKYRLSESGFTGIFINLRTVCGIQQENYSIRETTRVFGGITTQANFNNVHRLQTDSIPPKFAWIFANQLLSNLDQTQVS